MSHADQTPEQNSRNSHSSNSAADGQPNATTDHHTGAPAAASAFKAAAAPQPARRKPRLAIVTAAVVILGGGAYAYQHFIGARYVSTDNAYTAAEVAQITPAIDAITQGVRVVDTQHVRKGDILVELDATDARLALAQAEAELGRAERRVRTYQATDLGYRAQVAARDAEQQQADAQLKVAQADLDRAKLDLARRQALATTGSVSGEELSNAQAAFNTAQARMAAAHATAEQSRANRAATLGAMAANQALIEQSSLADNPEVALARAKRDQARVDVERTVLRAPTDGVVARRQIEVGQKVKAGTVVMTVVPTQQVHVDANFKEGQLGQVRAGQPVELKADLYGSSVVYHGVVTGLAGGTGSAFAAIPAQNATGNWIKVVQRVPVRVAIDPQELAQRPLQVGLSMAVSIDTRGEPSAALAALAAPMLASSDRAPTAVAATATATPMGVQPVSTTAADAVQPTTTR
ncbi:membrane fusion protein, multidrug efflux system [Roseateles sp. YR242]|uniref:HlyD family efflux transporter periplasmic adaptor subunit n=1 Tax=Roseateles sp. YR242 TaxID=1855305 RepID=UPI0008B55F2D|nr:HlyD family efflux transporter periplasmic adaptor subunit [Roseateles sp. YR242]SEL65468.1 membrane fusion protein, multidrug efflux system [Roseateles sp. YR242]